MSKTIAIEISGQPRFFKSSYTSLVQFMEGCKYDVFISTWDFQIPQDNLGSFRYPDEGTLAEFIELYKPKDFKIERWDIITEQFYIQQENRLAGQNYRADNYIRRYLPMLYKIWHVNEIRKNYELRNFKKYDIIIRTRSDIKYSLKFKDIFQKEKELYIDICGNGRGGAGDVFAYGTSDGINKYCDLFNCFEKYLDKCPLNTEFLLDYHLKNIGVNYELFNCKLGIIKP